MCWGQDIANGGDYISIVIKGIGWMAEDVGIEIKDGGSRAESIGEGG